MADDWSLTDAARADTVARLAANMTALAFGRGGALEETDSRAAAAAAEKKAYTTARVEARTTTGNRPATETAAAYTRKLAELALEVVKGAASAATTATPAAPAPTPPSTSDHDLDLHGDREFLVAESAEEHFADMLAAGAAHRKVSAKREEKTARPIDSLDHLSIHFHPSSRPPLSPPPFHRSASPRSPSAPTPPPSPPARWPTWRPR